MDFLGAGDFIDGVRVNITFEPCLDGRCFKSHCHLERSNRSHALLQLVLGAMIYSSPYGVGRCPEQRRVTVFHLIDALLMLSWRFIINLAQLKVNIDVGSFALP